VFGSPNSGRLSRDILDTCSGGVQDDCSRFVVDAVVLEGRSLRAVAQEHGVSKSWWRVSERAAMSL